MSHTKLMVIAYLLSWTAGFAVALLIGHLVIKKFLVEWLRPKIKEKAIKSNELEEIKPLFIDNWLIGICERPFFTALVAFNISGTAIAMISWILIKMAYNWGVLVREETVFRRSMAFSALLGNLCSMSFALVGGLICRIPSLLE